MEPQRPCIATVSAELPGQPVLTADGEEVGVVADVVKVAETDCGGVSHALVVKVEQEVPDLATNEVLIPDDDVLALTDHEVVLGTTMTWLPHHTIAEPPAADG